MVSSPQQPDGARTPGNLTFTQLRAFAAVVQELSYRRAAALLNYSPAAVHQQVRSLERALGLVLFQRSGSSLEVTAAGAELLPRVELMLDQEVALSQTARRLRRPNRVSIGSGRNTSVYMLIPLLARIQERVSHIDLDLHIRHADELVEAVITGVVDIAVSGQMDELIDRAGRIRHQVVLVPWHHDLPVLVSLPHASAYDIAERFSATRIFFPPYTRALLHSWLEHPPDHLVELDHWELRELETAESVKSAVAHGLGLGALPYSAVREDVVGDRLSVLATLSASAQPIYLLHRRPRLARPEVRGLIRALLEFRG